MRSADVLCVLFKLMHSFLISRIWVAARPFDYDFSLGGFLLITFLRWKFKYFIWTLLRSALLCWRDFADFFPISAADELRILKVYSFSSLWSLLWVGNKLASNNSMKRLGFELRPVALMFCELVAWIVYDLDFLLILRFESFRAILGRFGLYRLKPPSLSELSNNSFPYPTTSFGCITRLPVIAASWCLPLVEE